MFYYVILGRSFEPTQTDRSREPSTFQMRFVRKAMRVADRLERARQEQSQRDQVQLL